MFKLMNNYAYGKTFQSKRRRLIPTLAQNADQVLQNVSRSIVKAFKIFRQKFSCYHARPKENLLGQANKRWRDNSRIS